MDSKEGQLRKNYEGAIMMKLGILKKRKGAALISVIMAVAVIMILMSSIVFIARQDVLETTMQEKRLRTYYIAAAGIDLTYAALMDPDFEPKKLEAAITKLKGNGNTPLSDSIEIGDAGIANVTIKRVTVKDKDWLQITSIGKLTGENTEVTTTMRINEDNSNQIVREKFGQ